VILGQLIDAVSFPSPATSITVSPQNDFLATSHIGDLGIYLWTNVSLYKHVSLKPLPEDFVPKRIQMPTVKQSQEEILEQGLEDMDIKEEEEEEEAYTWDTDQVQADMVTLANLPEARWQNLLHLDVIKARNKPKVAPEKPKNAPFFLPTITGPDGLTRSDIFLLPNLPVL
jgi:U3 small nucleolar RNA-associated protein 21